MANRTQLRILRKSVSGWNQWRTENPDERPDLRGADLRGADLFGANLFGANLTDAEWNDRTVWPDGFEPPPRKTDRPEEALSEPAESVLIEPVYRPVRVESLDVARVELAMWGIEPLLAALEGILAEPPVGVAEECLLLLEAKLE